ncbi:uncharacterized protein TM35_000092370 [Trypanosoma theileri]|uniref:Uncharacterized protein n=1 Tax=Trypanosoma theileri TaxID=67003 RepID=A0A1X0NZS1_9TRYP|nr:uncharacterized protein TM35_000092370 [Trypanosoma theileri]ORC90187.1 hypothetical protein TM35_000092370 [Trypanosoma theileri]
MCTIEQVTVYTDVQDTELLNHITTVVRDFCKDAKIYTVPEKDAADPLAFLNIWEKERDDVWSLVKNNVPLMHRFECFVTDSKDEKSGAVAYALYYRKMPVLSLVTPVSNPSSTIMNNANNNNNIVGDNEEDWITAALYFTPAKLGCVSLFDAVKRFFSFPEKGGNVIAIEGEDAALVLSQCRRLRAHMQSESKMPVCVVDASGCDIHDMYTETTEYEKEEGLYDKLIEDFLKNSNNCEMQQIREAYPQFHGALSVLNRYHNLPLLRYRLQTGVSVILYQPFSMVLKELVCGCKQQGMNVTETQKLLSTVMPSLLHFERHWLGMPTAEVVLIREKMMIKNTTSSLAHWSSLLWSEEGMPIADVFSKWHQVVFKDKEGEMSAVGGGTAGDEMRQQQEKEIQNSINAKLQSFISL